MANLLDYLDWRGDLTFDRAPFCEVDNLILSELSYLDLEGIVPGPGQGTVRLEDAAEAFFRRSGRPPEKISIGLLLPSSIPVLLERAAALPRFREVRLGCWCQTLDEARAEQFAALTARTGDGCAYLAFRGTDDTIAGWKEDFLIGCVPHVPSQDRAAAYVQTAAEETPGLRLRLGGHSKGGNLAVYGAVFCPQEIQGRIESVWSNDGPGFREEVLASPEHRRVEDRIRTIVPKSSVVGMLLEHEEAYTVVDSSQIGLLQHDGFSWQVRGGSFVHLREVSRQGRRNDAALRTWVQGLTQDQREKFVDGLFTVLSSTGAATLSDLRSESFRGAGAMVRAMKDLDQDTRDALIYAVKLLFKSNLQALWEELQPAPRPVRPRGSRKPRKETK
jgi:hypothetical protein